MADGMPTQEQLLELFEQDASEPAAKVRLLAYRVSVLVIEKEDLEKRLAKLETAYTMGRGIFWVLTVLGVAIGYLTSNWGWMTRPWLPPRLP